MCGSSSTQNEVNQSQVQLQQVLTSQYQQEFANNQAILNELTNSLAPILSAGPSQQGYSAAEVAALNTQATQSASTSYVQAATAANETATAKGGGNSFIPSGGQEAIDAGIGVAAENQLSQNKLGITEANYEQGQKNFDLAVGSLASIPSAIESADSTFANTTTGAGSAAMTGATDINNANNSWEGLLGGIASSALGAATFNSGSTPSGPAALSLPNTSATSIYGSNPLASMAEPID